MDEQKKELKTTQAQRDASLKWERENNEKITIKLRNGNKPSKASIRECAEQAGESVNAYIVRAIRERMEREGAGV